MLFAILFASRVFEGAETLPVHAGLGNLLAIRQVVLIAWQTKWGT